MLLSIKSDVFRNKIIHFKKGLNVVLGDDSASNSIGKSSLLMIIDFVLGGDSYVEHNSDAILELGHHQFDYVLLVGGRAYEFSRNTENENFVRFKVGGGEDRIFKTFEYTKFLKDLYQLSDWNCNFRPSVGLYARVWGKENSIVMRPLHGFPSQKSSEAMDILISMFEKDKEIKGLSVNLMKFEKEHQNITGAFKANIVQKINVSKYKNNTKEMIKIEDEVTKIKTELSMYAINIKEIINKEVLEINVKKDVLQDKKLLLETKIALYTKNIGQAKYINSKNFAQLKGYFQNINENRLSVVDNFHSSISKILKSEIDESVKLLKGELAKVVLEIKEIDAELVRYFSNLNNPTAIIDRTHKLLQKFTEIKKENEIFDREKDVGEKIEEAKLKLDDTRLMTLAGISFNINDLMKELSNLIYGDIIRYPTVKFSNTDYDFVTNEDTGTGRAYSSLIIFDIAISRLTKLPILAHDSHLFKNIQNSAIENIISLYSDTKQSFVVIDELKKYSQRTQDYVIKNTVIRLDRVNTLYIKDWQRKGKA